MKQFKINDKVKLVKKCNCKYWGTFRCELGMMMNVKNVDGKITCADGNGGSCTFNPSQLRLLTPKKEKKTKTATKKAWAVWDVKEKKTYESLHIRTLAITKREKDCQELVRVFNKNYNNPGKFKVKELTITYEV